MELLPFGSSEYGLCLRESDLDMNAWARAELPGFFERARRVLERCGAQELRVAIAARIPLLTCRLRGLRLDLVHQTGHDSDWEHSKAVSAWVRRELQRAGPEARLVALFVKMWARRHALDRPYEHTLPSLAFLVMLFSTAATAAVPPSLLPPQPSASLTEFSSSAALPTASTAPASAAHLLVAFFSRFASW